jgi:hypothetical protein
MSPENTEKLLAAYPLLYRELREQCFECGDGWFDLVWQVSAEIESTAQHEGIPKTADAWPSVHILKQKFGALRAQSLNGYSEAIRALVEKAYQRSMETCEICGTPAKCDKERELAGWVETLCDTCRKKHRPPHPIRKNTGTPVWLAKRDGKLK